MSLNLRKLRYKHKETQKDMAKRVGISATYISHLEIGKRSINNKVLEKIGDAYDLNPTELLEIETYYTNILMVDLRKYTLDDHYIIKTFYNDFTFLSSKDKKEIEEILLYVTSKRDRVR